MPSTDQMTESAHLFLSSTIQYSLPWQTYTNVCNNLSICKKNIPFNVNEICFSKFFPSLAGPQYTTQYQRNRKTIIFHCVQVRIYDDGVPFDRLRMLKVLKCQSNFIYILLVSVSSSNIFYDYSSSFLREGFKQIWQE